MVLDDFLSSCLAFSAWSDQHAGVYAPPYQDCSPCRTACDGVTPQKPTLGACQPETISYKRCTLQVYFAHALTRYMNMTSPSDLESYGINGLQQLVTLLSQVHRDVVC